MEDITRAHLADMLGCSVALIKKYEDRFSEWLDSPPGTKGVAVAKVFTPEDVRTLSTIHAMRQAGVSYKNIEQQLDAALASGQYDVVIEEEVLEGEAQTSERFQQNEDPGVALVSERQVAMVVQLYERAREDYEEERQARLDAEKRAAAGDAIKEERDRLLEREQKLEDKVEVLQEELQSERTKSWWDRVRGK